MKAILIAGAAALALVAFPAVAEPGPVAPRPDQQAFRALYKELVETDTTLSHGSCTLAASRMATRLKAAGIPDSHITAFGVPEHPKDGGLVAVIPGRDPRLKPVLLLAHLDVVEARREDWVRDPFTLIEEGGYFYARGTLDDKAMAAVWTDTMARLAKGPQPRRAVKLALTCGEETDGAFNGAQWLARNRRELIDAAFALNEGGGGLSDGGAGGGASKLQTLSVQVGEKAYVDFVLTATNPGGHSSQPVRDNAIYAMADAMVRLRELEFPLQFNDTTRAFFDTAGRIKGGETGAAMVALAANPSDTAAQTIVDRDKLYHSLLRTTCVPTLISGGHAKNALPQKVTVNVNCRMFPGRTIAETQARLAAAIADPAIAIRPARLDKPIAGVPPMDPAVLGPMRKLAARHFPGVPVVPTMSTGATDGVYMSAVGIPTYGVPGLWTDPDGNGMHGLNERIAVRALMEGRDYLFDLVRAYID